MEDKILKFIKSHNLQQFNITYNDINKLYIEDIKSGESNLVYIVNANNKRIIVKVNGVSSKDEKFFFNEYNKLEALKRWRISPLPFLHGYIDENPIMILEYIEGDCIADDNIENHIGALIDLLNRLAGIPNSHLKQYRCFRKEIDNCYDYASMMVKFASTQLNIYMYRRGKDQFYYYFKSVIPKCQKYLASTKCYFAEGQLGLIHTGLHPANLILTGNGIIKAIDWEHANIGDRAFEISGLLRQTSLSKDIIDKIISRYNIVDKYLLSRSNIYSQIFKLHECLWTALRLEMAKCGELKLTDDKSTTFFAKRLKEKMNALCQAEYIK